MRKFSRFQLVDPDCKANYGDLSIKIYKLFTDKPKIEYNHKKKDVSDEIKSAVKIWVKHQKFGGLSLQEFLDATIGQND